RYYTPSGRSIHKDRPRHPEDEIVVEEVEEEADSEEGLAADPADKEMPRFAKEKFYTDSGRVVYGGGGINPDIEIEQDFLTDFEVAVERDGALFSYAVDYATDHAELPDDFEVSDENYRNFKEFLKGREKIEEYLQVFDLTFSDSLVDANADFIKRGVRRELARRAHGSTAAYKVAIEADAQLHEALELFRKASTLPDLLKLADEWNQEQMSKMASEESAEEEAAIRN
ncbi:MAG: carboxyl-terminal processing protease, partial [Candidatus Krumholzibacteriia bacterium]